MSGDGVVLHVALSQTLRGTYSEPGSMCTPAAERSGRRKHIDIRRAVQLVISGSRLLCPPYDKMRLRRRVGSGQGLFGAMNMQDAQGRATTY
jgi:hypothetical protein